MHRLLKNTFCVLICIASSQISRADVITSYSTPGELANSAGSQNLGQSVTTPSAVQYSEITFNFFGQFFDSGVGWREGASWAEGELFLLNQVYFGTADDLSASTPGFLAFTDSIQPEGEGNEWIFTPEVSLSPGEMYFFYVRNAGQRFGAIKAFTQGDPYTDGIYSQTATGNSNSNFGQSPGNDWHFELEGTPIPEPSTLLLGTLASVGLLMRRRHTS